MPVLDKKSLSERDICTQFITHALGAAGWDALEATQREREKLSEVLLNSVVAGIQK